MTKPQGREIDAHRRFVILALCEDGTWAFMRTVWRRREYIVVPSKSGIMLWRYYKERPAQDWWRTEAIGQCPEEK